MNPVRASLLILQKPKAPDAPKGVCKWCGYKIEYTDLAKGRRKTRTYHRGDRYEVGKQKCLREFKLSICWSGRDALRWRAWQERVLDRSNNYAIFCADCNKLVETGVVRVSRRAGFRCTVQARIRDWHADHEVPIWNDGAHELDNLRVRCTKPCHDEKTRREAVERAKHQNVNKQEDNDAQLARS